MEAITRLPTRMPTPPPAYSPPQRCYQMRAGSTQPCAYVPRGHPRSADAAQLDRRSTVDKKVLFYKPTGTEEIEPAPAYHEEGGGGGGDDDDDEEEASCGWTPTHQRNTSKLEARIRALEAQLAAQAGK